MASHDFQAAHFPSSVSVFILNVEKAQPFVCSHHSLQFSAVTTSSGGCSSRLVPEHFCPSGASRTIVGTSEDQVRLSFPSQPLPQHSPSSSSFTEQSLLP